MNNEIRICKECFCEMSISYHNDKFSYCSKNYKCYSGYRYIPNDMLIKININYG